MCCYMSMPCGIPIPDQVHNQYPKNVRDAWEKFDTWWHQHYTGDGPVYRSTIPADILEALRIITEAPIPGYNGATGADSCYVIGVTGLIVA
jgi:hypothetical protein